MQFVVIKEWRSTDGKWHIITDTQLGSSQPSELSTHHYYPALFISHLPLLQQTHKTQPRMHRIPKSRESWMSWSKKEKKKGPLEETQGGEGSADLMANIAKLRRLEEETRGVIELKGPPCVYLWQLQWSDSAERMLLLCGQFKREIRRGVKRLWQATNNIQSPRTGGMQFACFVKAEKQSPLLKDGKQNVSWGLARQRPSLFSPHWESFPENETINCVWAKNEAGHKAERQK